ncbi:uncharacterized protein SAPINGB_P002629 [Magnusiomyces paraingens]|uniref:Eukaryotic translation initiation factor 3 subunit B n=1 Tax=Magnusiomyces paraingens TaxID=2606893 RepID=A0A5E8BKN8_9ASCO|nr:uncharacterized protein SAPINGB_P002629 [Saprochaete ingens]VVT50157.1 unnamed protein product [Saprochaete ingens]
MAAERIASRDDDDLQLDYTDLERKYAVKDFGLENFIVIDNIPAKVPESKLPKLTKVLGKLFGEAGPIKSDGLNVPLEGGATAGYAFVEYETPEAAANAIKILNGKRLDAKHMFVVNKLSDIERYATDSSITDTYNEPEKTEFKPREHLRSWLTDATGRDQLFIHVKDVINVFWYKRTESPKITGKIERVDLPAKWSPKGTYLATSYSFGIQLNGGPSFGTLAQFFHFNATFFDFSPNERYLVTFSKVPIGDSRENDPENPKTPFGEKDRGNQIVIWDILTQLPLRSFRHHASENTAIWPIFKWSSDSKYFARIISDQLAIYETPSMSLLDKKSVSIPGIVDFSFAPTSVTLKGRNLIPGAPIDPNKKGDQVLCYWTPEINNQAARVSIMTVPSKEVIRTRNLFSVADCRFHWQDESQYLCVKVDRYTRNKKQTFTNLEFFRMTERDIPLENIELKDTVVNFAWEPKGNKFITISRTDNSVASQTEGGSGNTSGLNNLAFYGLDEKKKVTSSSWKLLKLFEKRNTNSIFWSPKGQFAATSNFGPNVSTPVVEFWDTDFHTEKREGIVDNSNGINNIGSYEQYGLVNLEWDPSGRFVAAWSNKTQSSNYKIINFFGEEIHEKNLDHLRVVSWRPRPQSLLTEEEVSKTIKNLDKYSAQFDEEDAMDADAATKELITKRRAQFKQWKEFRERAVAKLRGLGLVPEEDLVKQNADDGELIEETFEEIIEESVEVVE